jgi:hypothetical protein
MTETAVPPYYTYFLDHGRADPKDDPIVLAVDTRAYARGNYAWKPNVIQAITIYRDTFDVCGTTPGGGHAVHSILTECTRISYERALALAPSVVPHLEEKAKRAERWRHSNAS